MTPAQPSVLASEAGNRCCIVGGGPAGVVLGFLLARATSDSESGRSTSRWKPKARVWSLATRRSLGWV